MRLTLRSQPRIVVHVLGNQVSYIPLAAGLILFTMALSLGSCASSEAGESNQSKSSGSNEFPTMADNHFDRGHRAYLDNCSRCHGIRMQEVHQWLSSTPFSAYQMKLLVRTGSLTMQPFPDYVLDDFTLNELIEYLRILRNTSELDTSAVTSDYDRFKDR